MIMDSNLYFILCDLFYLSNSCSISHMVFCNKMTHCSCHIVKIILPQNFSNKFFLIVYVIYAQTWHKRNGTIVIALQNTKQNMRQISMLQSNFLY